MKIERHLADLTVMGHWFRRDSKRLDEFLGYAREDAQNLTRLHDFVAKNVYLAGATTAPDSPEVARAIRLSAQALGAVFALRFAPLPEEYLLGEGPPVHYSAPIDPSIPDVIVWRTAYHLALLARQAAPLSYLCRVTEDTFRGSGLTGYAREEYRLIELRQRLWLDPGFEWEPLLTERQAIESHSAESSDEGAAEIIRCLNIPYLHVMRAVGERDAAGVERALTDALLLHKAYWSATEERRNERTGLVSVPLAGLAALAWDRGLRFSVESDYLPWSWVTGELFQRAPETP